MSSMNVNSMRLRDSPQARTVFQESLPRGRSQPKTASQGVEQRPVVIRQLPEHRASETLRRDILPLQPHGLRVLVRNPFLLVRVVQPGDLGNVIPEPDISLGFQEGVGDYPVATDLQRSCPCVPGLR